jgi:hypothetical protein
MEKYHPDFLNSVMLKNKNIEAYSIDIERSKGRFGYVFIYKDYLFQVSIWDYDSEEKALSDIQKISFEKLGMLVNKSE